VIRVGIGLGVNKVRITGGEPLVRKGVTGFLGRLTAMDGLRDVSLTTNGVRLEENVDAIRAAVIRRINVSLDTLDPATYLRITRRDRFDRVWNGIMAAHRAGFDPIKINVVALGGINDDDMADLAGLTYDYPFHVRFIEYMPIGDVDPDHGRQIFGDDILERVGRFGTLTPVARQELDGPARRYRLAGARGEIGIIGAVSHHFCGQCNRLRLTASGRLRTCLLSDQEIDLIGPLRRGCSDSDLESIFIQAARRKQERHHLSEPWMAGVNDRMSAIGG
jgi:cyclic pyranopterin phosphate synthase